MFDLMIEKLLVFALLAILLVNCSDSNSGRVKLTDVQTLTLNKGAYTTSKRTQSILQINCLGGNAGCKYAPDVVQCYNHGLDGFDVQWDCKADLDKSVKFGLLRMSCEGYDYPSDPFILAGSCGLEYTLDYKSQSVYDNYYKDYYQTNRIGNFLTLLIMVVIILSVYKTCTKFHERRDIYIPNQPVDPNEFIGYDYPPTSTLAAHYPAPPPPYGFQPVPTSDPALTTGTYWSSGNNTTTTNDANFQHHDTGYETPPPEYEEKKDDAVPKQPAQ